MLFRSPTVSDVVGRGLTAMGVPESTTPLTRTSEALGRAAMGGVTQAETFRRMASTLRPGVAQSLVMNLAQGPGAQAVSNVTSAAAAQATAELGGGPFAQTMASLAGGFVPGVVSGASAAVPRGQQSLADIQARVNRASNIGVESSEIGRAHV